MKGINRPDSEFRRRKVCKTKRKKTLGAYLTQSKGDKMEKENHDDHDNAITGCMNREVMRVMRTKNRNKKQKIKNKKQKIKNKK